MRIRNAARLIIVGLAFVMPATLFGFAATSAAAATSDFTFDSMSSEYFLGRDADGNATLRTVETLVAVFPDYDQNRGIERAIPLTYGPIQLDVKIVDVTDENGQSMPYSRTDDDGFAIIRIGSASVFVHGAVTYRIEYTQRNVVRSFTDTNADEFYWDVNGTGWGQPFGVVSATVHLTDGIADSLTGKFACYQGYEGSTDRCAISRTGDSFTASATDLLAGQNMTIAIGFENGTFAEPPDPNKHWVFAILPWILLALSGGALVLIIAVRLFVWRDSRGRGIIIPQYSPPENAYPMLAAALLGRTKSALPAQIVRFAVAKILAIRERPDKSKNDRYQLEVLEGWQTTPKDEEWVLSALFGSVATGKMVVLDQGDVAIGDR